MGINAWWISLQIEGCGISCQIHQEQVQNNEIWDTTEVKERSEWETLITEDRDWETDTNQAVCVIKRMELTVCERRHRDRKPEKPVVVLVTGSREQIHKAFDVITLEKFRRCVLL